MTRLGVVTKAVVKGVGLTCIARGVLGGLGFRVTGLPSPLLFGTVMAPKSSAFTPAGFPPGPAVPRVLPGHHFFWP